MSGAHNAALAYDPLGRLSQLTAAGITTTFLYDGDALVAEYEGATLKRRYAHWAGSDAPLLWFTDTDFNSPYYLHADQQGSIVMLSGAGTPTINRYDEYGIPQSTNVGRFQYTGQAYLTELGLYYYKARIYSPTLGRFLQTDRVGYEGGINLYAYVGDDPINRTDPSGNLPPESMDPNRDSWSRGRPPAPNERRNHSAVGHAAVHGAEGSVRMVEHAARETGASARDLRPVRAMGHSLRLVGAAITYHDLHQEGHSAASSAAGAVASEGTNATFTATGAFIGSLVEPGLGTAVGAAVGYGIDAWTGSSDRVGSSTATAVTNIENGTPRELAHRAAQAIIERAMGSVNYRRTYGE